MTPCTAIQIELEPLLAGELAPAARQQVEQHLADCPGCRAALASLKEVVLILRLTPAPEEAIPAGFGQELLQGRGVAVRPARQAARLRRSRSAAIWWAVAALMLVALMAGLWMGSWESTGPGTSDQTAEGVPPSGQPVEGGEGKPATEPESPSPPPLPDSDPAPPEGAPPPSQQEGSTGGPRVVEHPSPPGPEVAPEQPQPSDRELVEIPPPPTSDPPPESLPRQEVGPVVARATAGRDRLRLPAGALASDGGLRVGQQASVGPGGGVRIDLHEGAVLLVAAGSTFQLLDPRTVELISGEAVLDGRDQTGSWHIASATGGAITVAEGARCAWQSKSGTKGVQMTLAILDGALQAGETTVKAGEALRIEPDGSRQTGQGGSKEPLWAARLRPATRVLVDLAEDLSTDPSRWTGSVRTVRQRTALLLQPAPPDEWFFASTTRKGQPFLFHMGQTVAIEMEVVTPRTCLLKVKLIGPDDRYWQWEQDINGGRLQRLVIPWSELTSGKEGERGPLHGAVKRIELFAGNPEGATGVTEVLVWRFRVVRLREGG